jgi:large subunit ribosomal protein L18
MIIKAKRYEQRKRRVRAKINGTALRPRLTVYKSTTHIYGQLIDDDKQVTLVSASDIKVKTGKKLDRATKVGEDLAKLAIAKKIKKVTFDRNGFKFHGRVKALAEGARKGGLDF